MLLISIVIVDRVHLRIFRFFSLVSILLISLGWQAERASAIHEDGINLGWLFFYELSLKELIFIVAAVIVVMGHVF